MWLLSLPMKLASLFKGIVLPFLSGKKRILIEYALIAVVIATAGLTVTMWAERFSLRKQLTTANQSLTTLRGRLNTVELVNSANQATIKELQDLRQTDSETLAGLVNDYNTLTERERIARRKVSDLEKRNEEVRTFLDQRLPDDLRELLNERSGR